MGSLKSRDTVGIYCDLVCDIVRENPCNVPTLDVIRDVETIRRRVSSEGMSFLTVALPKLWKAVQRGLESGVLIKPEGFKPSRMGDQRPAFLHRYVSQLFDSRGVLLTVAKEVGGEDPQLSMARAAKHVYQICYFLYKLELPYRPEQEAAVVQKFVQTESELDFDLDERTSELLTKATGIISSIFAGFDPYEIQPRHGPGAVATGEKQEGKWGFKRLYYRLHQCYDYLRYFGLGGVETLQGHLENVLAMEFHDSGVAKVVLVPKDSRGPRLISCEPLEYQWIQQGLGRKIMAHLERHPLTRGRVNFTDQSVNRSLALKSSSDGSFATIDLEAASDRVSLALVEVLFDGCPELLKALKATRTTATKLPDGTVIPLRKYAPMGSALCFPVESICFWALAVAAAQMEFKSPLKSAAMETYTYGDDIVVTTRAATVVMEMLERVALKVNRDKSCIVGAFRESCGMDALHGVEITPVKMHRTFSYRRDPSSLAAYASAANRLAARGYKRASARIWNELESIWGRIPWGTELSPFVCKLVDRAWLAESLNRDILPWRYSERWQRYEFHVHTALRQGTRTTDLDGEARLLRNQVYALERPDQEVIPDSLKWQQAWLPVAVALSPTEMELYGR